jgi:transcriptional regulator with XRE-family HTH domain
MDLDQKKKAWREALRRWRIESDITTVLLGHALGVTSSAVSQWESGVRFPGQEIVDAICEASGHAVPRIDVGAEARGRMQLNILPRRNRRRT